MHKCTQVGHGHTTIPFLPILFPVKILSIYAQALHVFKLPGPQMEPWLAMWDVTPFITELQTSLGSESILYDTIMVDLCHYSLVQIHKM